MVGQHFVRPCFVHLHVRIVGCGRQDGHFIRLERRRLIAELPVLLPCVPVRQFHNVGSRPVVVAEAHRLRVQLGVRIAEQVRVRPSPHIDGLPQVAHKYDLPIRTRQCAGNLQTDPRVVLRFVDNDDLEPALGPLPQDFQPRLQHICEVPQAQLGLCIFHHLPRFRQAAKVGVIWHVRDGHTVSPKQVHPPLIVTGRIRHFERLDTCARHGAVHDGFCPQHQTGRNALSSPIGREVDALPHIPSTGLHLVHPATAQTVKGADCHPVSHTGSHQRSNAGP